MMMNTVFSLMFPNIVGPSIKDVCTQGGEGVSQKRTHVEAGGGGSVAISGCPQIQTFCRHLSPLWMAPYQSLTQLCH